MYRARALVPRLSLLAIVVLVLGACAPPSGLFGTGKASKPTVRIGATNFGEQVLLAELYAQALEAVDYRVERRLNLGSREVVEPALENGQIDLYPEYLATLLAFVTKGARLGSHDPAATHRELHEVLAPLALAALQYAPAINTNGFVVTAETASRHGLSKVSDLRPLAPQLVLGGPPECPIRPFCLPGLRQTYGITFRDFRVLDAGGPLTVSSLEKGQVDVGLLFTTDPLLASRHFVLLEDDRGLQLADNVVPVVRTDTLNRMPPDFLATLDEVSRRLTTAELTALNGQVALDQREPRVVAAGWLKAQSLAK